MKKIAIISMRARSAPKLLLVWVRSRAAALGLTGQTAAAGFAWPLRARVALGAERAGRCQWILQGLWDLW